MDAGYLKIFPGIIWELPQNILGAILWLIYRKKVKSIEVIHRRIFLQVSGFGISLGSFIFWSYYPYRDIRKHEYGHSIQSLIFGPLYLLIIGIPSLSRAVYSRLYFRKHGTPWKNYFNAYPENWADRLGERYF
jgi:hypothetical protein